MTDVSAVNNVFSDYAVQRQTQEERNNELGQSAFLELMITQMRNQDPTAPQENTEFIAQLAQFSSVESLDRLNNNFDTFSNSFVANQALQASSLVGRSVSVPTDTTALPTNGLVNMSVDIPTSVSGVSINIYKEGGELVDQLAIGSQAPGEMVMRWDGLSAEVNGELLDWESSVEDGLPPGNYTFEVTAEVDGTETQLDTSLSANVNSVTVGADGRLTLNLAGVGAVNMSDVKQFN